MAIKANVPENVAEGAKMRRSQNVAHLGVSYTISILPSCLVGSKMATQKKKRLFLSLAHM